MYIPVENFYTEWFQTYQKILNSLILKGFKNMAHIVLLQIVADSNVQLAPIGEQHDKIWKI